MGKEEKVSQSPTNPIRVKKQKKFDVADLYQGPVAGEEKGGEASSGLDEKLRQAYFWIVNNAIISPYYDIEYNDGAAASASASATRRRRLTLPSGQSYSQLRAAAAADLRGAPALPARRRARAAARPPAPS